MTNLLQRISQIFYNLFKKRKPKNLNSKVQYPFGADFSSSSAIKIASFPPSRNRYKTLTKAIAKFKRSLQSFWVSSALVFCSIVWLQNPESLISAASAASTIQPPLSTNGSKIVDSTGTTVLLRGVNWFGMETENHAPFGLNIRDYKEMLAQIKSLGYNIIRFPYSVKALSSSNISGIDFSIGNNKDFQGKTPLEVMDLIIAEAQKQGLMIMLDSHRLNDSSIPELWYGDGFSEADWIKTWTDLATRYKNQPNVIGADLKNEPHGQATWGTNNQATDWRLAAERAGSAIQAINPNWLIIVEGISQSNGKYFWAGGDLTGVASNPVRLPVAKKLVYSPHEYGQGVYNQPWFSDPTFPNNMPARWEMSFNYIATQGIAPILVGEFGGRQVDSSSKEGIWQQKFVDYVAQKNLSFTYWSWNPNSDDTGGILQDDWRTVNAAKQQLLNKLVPVPGLAVTSTPTPAPTPAPAPAPATAPTPAPTPPPTTAPTGSPQLKAEAVIQSDWDKGFCVNLNITNQGTASTKNWQMTFQLNQATINNAWGANFLPQGTSYLVKPESWSQVIQPQQTYVAGYCANKTGTNYKPSQVAATSF
jgi:endoglucanase